MKEKITMRRAICLTSSLSLRGNYDYNGIFFFKYL